MSPAPRSRKRGCDAAPQGRSSARSDPTRVQRRARGPLHSEGYRRGPQTATTSRTRWYCGGYLTDYPTQSTGLKGTRLEQPNRTPILALRRRNADARQRIREHDLLGKEKHWMPANCTRCIPRAGSAGAGKVGTPVRLCRKGGTRRHSGAHLTKSRTIWPRLRGEAGEEVF